MAKRPPSYFFEPWSAARSRAWESSFRREPLSADDPDKVAAWRGERAKAEADAEWTLWGSDVWQPAVAYALDGSPVADIGSGIVAVVRPIKSDHPRPPDHEAVAVRIAACVNACAGIADPVAAVEEARRVLLAIVNWTMEPTDLAVTRAMSALFPSGSFDSSQRRIFANNEELPE